MSWIDEYLEELISESVYNCSWFGIDNSNDSNESNEYVKFDLVDFTNRLLGITGKLRLDTIPTDQLIESPTDH